MFRPSMAILASGTGIVPMEVARHEPSEASLTMIVVTEVRGKLEGSVS